MRTVDAWGSGAARAVAKRVRRVRRRIMMRDGDEKAKVSDVGKKRQCVFHSVRLSRCFVPCCMYIPVSLCELRPNSPA